jgi:hypothetical protein
MASKISDSIKLEGEKSMEDGKKVIVQEPEPEVRI